MFCQVDDVDMDHRIKILVINQKRRLVLSPHTAYSAALVGAHSLLTTLALSVSFNEAKNGFHTRSKE